MGVKHLHVMVPDEGDIRSEAKMYEIYTPIENGIEDLVVCEHCKYSRTTTFYLGGDQQTECLINRFKRVVKPTDFCSWGEGKHHES